jgi:hypothetical protein
MPHTIIGQTESSFTFFIKQLARTSLNTSLILVLTLSGLTISISSNVNADMISSDLIAEQLELESRRQSVESMLGRQDIRNYLLSHGVAETDLDLRVANLTDTEVQQVYDMMDQLPVGEGAGGLETVVFILLIFILLDVAGVTDIFPGI